MPDTGLVPKPLNDMSLDRANQLYMHPMHRDAYFALPGLILSLRQIHTYENYYEFQQDLLSRVLDVQSHRAACTRVAKRLRNGRSVPTDAPDLRSGGDVNDPEVWELEADVCERVQRQLRSVADGLAWRIFDYDRRVIVALSRNAPAGPMVPKKGLENERAFLERAWKEERSFVLLHDLTTCLRIGDATEFKAVGKGYEAYLHELKTNPEKRRSVQLRCKRLAEEAIRDGGPLPNDPRARLLTLDVPYRTHFKILRDAFDQAATRGVVGMKVPGGRVLVAANLPKGYELWPEAEFIDRTGAAYDAVCKRAGIVGRGHHVTFASNDIVAQSPTMPPWAIYPLDPAICAGLIADQAVFFVTVSSEPLIEALRDAGLSARWLLPSDLEQLQHGQAVIRIHDGVHATELRSSEIKRLTLELVQLPTWIAGIKETFAHPELYKRPWHQFAGERKVWA